MDTNANADVTLDTETQTTAVEGNRKKSKGSEEVEEEVEEEAAVGAQPITPVKATRGSRAEKPYSCSQCGKEYASRSGLKGHMKSHAGTGNSGPAPPPANSKDTPEDPSAISANGSQAEVDQENQSANKGKESSTEQPMETSDVGKEAD